MSYRDKYVSQTKNLIAPPTVTRIAAPDIMKMFDQGSRRKIRLFTSQLSY